MLRHKMWANSLKEGLLLGKVSSHVVDTISDSQISNLKENTNISVYAFLRCDSGLSWYDNCGRVDMAKLRALLPNGAHRDVIGWFKMRRNSSLALSLRERAVHRQLLSQLPGRRPEHFVFLLGCGEEGRHQTTHTLSHVFYTLTDSGIKPLSAEILNLGDTSHNEYKHATAAPTGEHSHNNPLHQSIQSLKNEFCKSDGHMRSVASINHLTATVHNQLQSLCSGVARSEDILGKLRSEIKELQQNVDRKRAIEEGKAATIKTNLIATNVISKPDGTSSDATLDRPPLSPRQRLSGSDVSPKPRRMSSLSDFESTSRQYDLMETAEECRYSNQINEQISMTKEVKEENLISFDDEENDNVSNLPLDKQIGFEDNFLDLNKATLTTPTPVLTPNVAPMNTAKPNEQNTVLPSHPPAPAKTLQQVAREKKVASQSSRKEEQMECDKGMNADPFRFIAEVKKAELSKATTLGKTRKPQIKAQTTSRSTPPLQSTMQNLNQTDNKRTTRKKDEGQPQSVKGQGHTVQDQSRNSPSTPRKNAASNEKESEGSETSNSPLF